MSSLMRLHRLRSSTDYHLYREKERDELLRHESLLASLLPPVEHEFEVNGFSYVAGREVAFKVDFQWSGRPGQVNWRDRVSCPITGFTNRWRATIHLFDIEVEAYPDSSIYITEQVTPLFEYFSRHYRNL